MSDHARSWILFSTGSFGMDQTFLNLQTLEAQLKENEMVLAVMALKRIHSYGSGLGGIVTPS